MRIRTTGSLLEGATRRKLLSATLASAAYSGVDAGSRDGRVGDKWRLAEVLERAAYPVDLNDYIDEDGNPKQS